MSTITQPLHILVFKTNIRFDIDLQHVQFTLSHLPGILHWNVDRHDADNILRIEANSNIAKEVIAALNHAGYACAELED